jgi:hypothetical protein
MTMDSRFSSKNIERLGNDAFMLRGYIDQPMLKKLPVYSRFVDAVGALPVPDNTVGKAAQPFIVLPSSPERQAVLA